MTASEHERLSWSLSENGFVILSGKIDLKVAAQSTQLITLAKSIPAQTIGGDSFLKIEVVLSADKPSAEKGFVAATEQFELAAVMQLKAADFSKEAAPDLSETDRVFNVAGRF